MTEEEEQVVSEEETTVSNPERSQEETHLILTDNASVLFIEYLNQLNAELHTLRLKEPYTITKEYEELLVQEFQLQAQTGQVTQAIVEDVLSDYGSPVALADKYLYENPDEQLEEPVEIEIDQEREGRTEQDQDRVEPQEDEIDQILKRIIPETPNVELLVYLYLTISFLFLGYSIFRYQADLTGYIRVNNQPAHRFVLLFIGYEVLSLFARSKIIPYPHYLKFRSLFTSLMLISILSNLAFYFETEITFFNFYEFTLVYLIYFVVIYLNDLIIQAGDAESWWKIFSPSQIVLLVGLMIGLGTLGLAGDNAAASHEVGFDLLIVLSMILALVSLFVDYYRTEKVTLTKLIFVFSTPMLMLRLYTYAENGNIMFGDLDKLFNQTLLFYLGYALCLIYINNRRIKRFIVSSITMTPKL